MGISKYLLAAFALVVFTGAANTAPAIAADIYCLKGCNVEDPFAPGRTTLIRREQIKQGVYEIAREPAQYGWVEKRVVSSVSGKGDYEYKTVRKRILLRQYKNIAVYDRGEYELVREKVTIYPEEAGSYGRSWK